MNLDRSGPEPIGIGTDQVESLSSYVMRLAAWHGTLPGQLLHRYLAHIAAGQPEFSGRWHCNPTPIYLDESMNGFGHGEAWVRVLKEFTGRSDLAALTTCGWDHVFSSRHFRCRSQRRCLPCLAEQKEPYHRLVWTLDSVEHCPLHGCRLVERCPTCERCVPVVHKRSQVLACPWCAGGLLVEAQSSSGSEDEIWITREAGKLVSQSLEDSSSLRPFAGPSLRRLAKQCGIKTPTSLARIAGVTKVGAWNWWNDENRPCLRHALRLSRVLGVSLSEAISPDGGATRPIVPLQSCQIPLALSARRSSRRHDWDQIRSVLQREIENPPEEARPLTEIARDLEIAPRTLRAHLPEICAAISTRNCARRHRVSVERYEALKSSIQTAFEKARTQGRTQRQGSLSSITTHAGLFSRPAARRALAEIRGGKAVWPTSVTFPGSYTIIY